ncbi:MAG TPA: dihydrodipicolinate synthase family protein [Bryobacteraceae bacterium]|jgi:4-hydroxy-tetrahydrodipicolinate synthase|nr:dihydrodipicolinate synthase family protein [Bryobacteraceae bacterium]
MSYPVSGVLAALITPIDDRGRVDLNAFERVIEFVLERGVEGVVVGGGTAEYPHFALDDRAALAEHAMNRVDGRGKVVAAVGTSSIHSTLQLARRAAGAGCDALLIPMPYFFRYQQQDLEAFCQEVCASVSTPCFLYNLPSFTNPLDVDTAVRLLKTAPNLVGMKDSSGQKASLEPLARARGNGGFSLFVGDDSLLLDALRAGWDGVVSGIACFAPELIAGVYRSHREGNAGQAAAYQAELDAIIEQIVKLPIPWGVREGLAARGIENGPMHVPPSAERREQMAGMRTWLGKWAEGKNLKLDGVWSL